jgi:hypothetical protein
MDILGALDEVEEDVGQNIFGGDEENIDNIKETDEDLDSDNEKDQN